MSLAYDLYRLFFKPVIMFFRPKWVMKDRLHLMREAYLGGKLAAQQPGGLKGCYYRRPSDNAPCIVGSALSDKEVAKVMEKHLNASSARAVIDELFKPIPEPEMDYLSSLQWAHDKNDLSELNRLLFSPPEFK